MCDFYQRHLMLGEQGGLGLLEQQNLHKELWVRQTSHTEFLGVNLNALVLAFYQNTV